MSDLKINNITNRGGDGGPVIAGVSTVATSAFMVMPSGDTAIRGAGSGRGIVHGNCIHSMQQLCFIHSCLVMRKLQKIQQMNWSIILQTKMCWRA